MKCFLALVGVIALSTAVLADDIDSDSHQKTTGSTRSKGSYRIFKDGDKVKVELNFSVRKSGVNGTGKGVMGFVLADANGNTLAKKDKGFTVGADISGHHEKKYNETITLFGNAAKKIVEEGGIVAYTVQTDSDTIGIPRNPKEWKDTVADIVEIYGTLEAGQCKEVKDWFIKRIVK